MAGVDVANFVGDGLLLDISDLGAFNSHLIPSAGFFDGTGRPGDDDDGATTATGGSVLSLIGTKALRTSSAADSLPLSLGLIGGVLDGLFGNAGVLFVGIPGYSVGYLT